MGPNKKYLVAKVALLLHFLKFLMFNLEDSWILACAADDYF